MRKLSLDIAGRDHRGVSFFDGGGNPISLADSNGRIRVVNFWATWCAPCREEKPSLDALQSAMGGPDFAVIAIATGRNSPEGIERFNREVGITHLARFTDPKSQAAREMGVLALPVTVLVDREGREIGRLTGGADWNSDSARAIIAALIAGS